LLQHGWNGTAGTAAMVVMPFYNGIEWLSLRFEQ
jgi:hypothetical protein